MKVRIKGLPNMAQGGLMNNMPFAGATPTNPFGLIQSDTSNLDKTYNSTVKPIDKEKANIEAEKGEVLFKFDAGGIFKIAGKKHSEGGTPLKAEAGDFIFSDDRKLAITKGEAEQFDLKHSPNGKKYNTPAKVLSKEVDLQQYNKFLAILQDPKADSITKATAQLMLKKYSDKIGQVGYLQEAKKQFPQGMPDFAQGTAPVTEDGVAHEQEQAEHYKQGGWVLPKKQSGGAINSTQRNNSGHWDGNGHWIPDYPEAQGSQQASSPAGVIHFRPNSSDVIPPTRFSTLPAAASSTRPPSAGTPRPQAVNPRWGLWQGDIQPDFRNRYGVNNAADKIGNLDYLSQRLGYNGPKDNASFQRWLYNSSPENKNIIDQWHDNYSVGPNGGMFDGKIGIRWQNAMSQILHAPQPIPGNPPREPFQFVPPTATVKTPFGPNKPNAPEVPFTGFNLGMNPMEVLSGITPYLSALSQPTYYDMLTQKYSPNLRLDRQDNTEEINEVQQQSSLAQREMFNNLSGQTASLASGDVRAQEAGNIMRSNAQKLGQNTNIANQESMTNYQTAQSDNAFNLQNIHQTYNNNVLAQQRRNEQVTNGAIGSISNFQAIQNNLDTINQQATAAVLPYLSTVDMMDSKGNPIKVQVPPITFGPNRVPVPTGFGSLNSVGVQMLQNMPDVNDYKGAMDYFMGKGMSPDKAGQAAAIIFYGKNGQRSASNMQYNPSNPFASMMSGLYHF